MLKAHFR